jgi:Na+-driven multidrug efflux pump
VAVRPSVLDDTSSPQQVVRALWRLGWPLAIMLQLVAYSEATAVYWLGHLLGPPALAVEATMRHMFGATTWIVGFAGGGVSVLVSRSVGARDGHGLAIVVNGVMLTLAMWLVLVAIVVPLGGPISEVLASRQVTPAALRGYFTPWLLLSLPGITLLATLLGASSGAGWTRLTMTRSIIDIALTAAAVPLAVGVVGLGVGGAPIAVGTVQLVMTVAVWRALLHYRDRWHLGELPPPQRWFDKQLWLQMIDIGLPPQIARVAMLGAYAYLVQRVSHDGRDAVAAYGIAVLLMFVAFNLTSAPGRAASILVGQLAGARAHERIRGCVRTSLVTTLAVSALPVLVYVAFGQPIASLFAGNDAVVSRAYATLLVICIAIPCMGICQLYLFVLTALKRSKSAGLLGVLGDVSGIAFALTWPGDDRLRVVAWSIVVSNGVRTLAYAALWRAVLPRIEHGAR